MKKLTSILLALLMALTLLPTAVFAEVTLTGNGTANDPYVVSTDTELLEAIGKGGFVKLNGNVTLAIEENAVFAALVKKDLTIDLNGKKLTGKRGGTEGRHVLQVVCGATLTINGTTSGSEVFGRINVGIAPSDRTKANLDADANINGTLILNGGKYHSANNATVLHVNGNTTNAVVTITNAVIESPTDNAIQLNGKGTFTITDSLITGATAIYTKAGTLTAKNSTLKGTLQPANYAYNGNGSNATGDAVVVDSCCYPGGAPNVTFESSTVSGTKAAVGIYEIIPTRKTSSDSTAANVTIKSGEFSATGAYDTIAVNTDSTNSKPTSSVVSISGGTFDDPCALKYAKSGANVTIKLDKNMTENVVVPAGVTATLDLNGFTLKNSAADHTITVNKDATLTINGTGTVDNVSNGKAALYNKGTVILNGGTYTRSAENGSSKTDAGGNSFYNIVNYGTMTINDGVTVEQRGGYSSMVVNGYQNQKQTKYADTPTLTIAGGTFKGGLNTIKNDDNGNLTITGGTFENYTQACVQNHHVAAISGGTYTSTSEVASAVLNCGIKGCDAVDADKHELTISGGTFDGALVKTAGKLAITGGTFSTSPAKYLPATGYAVTYNGTSYIVSEKKDVDAGTDDKGTSVVEIETTNKVENVAIPSAAIEEGKELTVNGTDTSATTTDKTVSVTLNAAAVNTVANEGDLTLTVTTKEAKNNANVADENKAAYTEATKSTSTTNAVVVSIDLKAGEDNVFTNGADGAYAIVTVPYKAGLKNVTVHHLGATGVVTKLTSANSTGLTANNTFYYDSANGVITMRLAHFSQYLLNGTTAGTPYRPRPVGTGTTTTTTTTGKAQSPTTFDAGIAIYGVMAVSSVLGMGYMGKKKFF